MLGESSPSDMHTAFCKPHMGSIQNPLCNGRAQYVFVLHHVKRFRRYSLLVYMIGYARNAAM